MNERFCIYPLKYNETNFQENNLNSDWNAQNNTPHLIGIQSSAKAAYQKWGFPTSVFQMTTWKTKAVKKDSSFLTCLRWKEGGREGRGGEALPQLLRCESWTKCNRTNNNNQVNWNICLNYQDNFERFTYTSLRVVYTLSNRASTAIHLIGKRPLIGEQDEQH